jgi:hypothetical protein
VSDSTARTGSASGNVLQAADTLTQQSHTIRGYGDRFLATVRAEPAQAEAGQAGDVAARQGRSMRRSISAAGSTAGAFLLPPRPDTCKL